MEEEANLPLTVSSIAARTHVSVRSLQLAFRQHLGMSPMAYLREVRLRRAHQILLHSDPSTVTVSSVAYRWGFTNPGSFSRRAYTRYGETPVVTLSRRYFGVNGNRNLISWRQGGFKSTSQQLMVW
jgi:transcriptional regulator GlxA family with amidase domain